MKKSFIILSTISCFLVAISAIGQTNTKTEILYPNNSDYEMTPKIESGESCESGAFRMDASYLYGQAMHQWQNTTNNENFHGFSLNISNTPALWAKSLRLGFGFNFLSNYAVREDVSGFPFSQYMQVRTNSGTMQINSLLGWQSAKPQVFSPFLYLMPGLNVLTTRSSLTNKRFRGQNDGNNNSNTFDFTLQRQSALSFSVGAKAGFDLFLDKDFGLQFFGGYIWSTPVDYVLKQATYLDEDNNVNYNTKMGQMGILQIGVGFVFR